MKKLSFVGAFVIFILLLFYWRYNIGPVTGNPDCLAEREFLSYEFEAEVVNKYEGGDSKAVTLVTFKKQPATIDLTLEKNGLYEKLVIGDTLKKKFNDLSIEIYNFEKKETFDLDFECE